MCPDGYVKVQALSLGIWVCNLALTLREPQHQAGPSQKQAECDQQAGTGVDALPM
jgi:hypothetical protein